MHDSCLHAVVVNDSATQLALLAPLIRQAGLQPRIYSSAESALHDAPHHPSPALVITDLNMPGIDGWRFCRLLRSPEYPRFNSVPIFVVSATFSGDSPERITADLGADAFFPCPLDGPFFVEKIKEILRGERKPIPLRTLIVEDSPTLSELLRKAFSAAGYLADTALTLADANRQIDETSYEVLIIDYHLPDGSGDALLDRLHAEMPAGVCIMMTTDPSADLALDWMKRGAAAYLRKPFQPAYLLELCARSRRERALLLVEKRLEARTRQLHESEALLARSQQIAHIGSWKLDLSANQLAWSDEVYRIFGQRPQEFAATYEAFLASVHPDDREAVHAAYRNSLQEGIQSYEVEHRIVRKDTGEVRHVYERCIHERDETGKVSCSIGMVQDITESRQARKTLRESEERYRLIADNTSDSIWAMGPDLRFTYLSPSTEKLFGYPLEEWNDLDWGRFVHPDYLSSVLELFAGLSQGQEDRSATAAIRVFHRDGREMWVEFSTSSIHEKNGRLSGFVGVTRDITKRQMTELSLANAKAMVDAAFAQTPIPMVLISLPDAVLRYANAACLEFLDVADEPSHIGQPLFAFPQTWQDYDATGRQQKLEEMPLARAARGECTHNREYYVVTKRGNRRWELVSASPIYNQAGERIAAYAVFPDITERKRSEEEHSKLQAQLTQAQRMESVGRLAGGVAHDFNNMLGVILGHAEMALDRAGPDQAIYSDLQEIRRAAERSAEITRQLLAFARKQTVLPRVLDLNETLEGMFKMLRRMIGEDIELAWLPANRPLPVRIDPSQIDQILANLIVNARDAIAGIGRITLETGSMVFDEKFGSENEGLAAGPYVFMAVSDNGCGMDPKVLASIFEPFFTTKELGKGTGLGLATVYGIVKQNEGVIRVSSEPGSGSRFTIYLPRYSGTAESPECEARPGGISAKGLETILLVEDEPANLKMTALLLERQGYAVLTCASPREALHLAESYRGKLDLLVTDVVMPEMNGHDLAQNLLNRFPGLKRLFMSGYPADVIAHHGVLEPGVHFIQKPFTLRELASKIREALETS